MLKSHLKIAFRKLLKEKSYSFSNVASLSLGMACCFLIVLFVEHESSFDRFHRHADRLYRALEVERKIGGTESAMAYQPLPLAPALEMEIPEIEHAVRLFSGSGTLSYGENNFAADFTFTDPPFFEIFDFPLLQGNPASALDEPNGIVLTRRMAEKYFGSEGPLGKQMTARHWRGEVEVIVTGVAENPPNNSSVQFDFIMHITQYPNYERNLNRWGNFNGSTFVLLREDASLVAVQSKLPAFVSKFWGEVRQSGQAGGELAPGDDAMQLRLQPIAGIHLDASVGSAPEARSNPLYSYILSGIAVLVLVIACINFITLAIGRSLNRAKEVGVRKVLGAHRIQLIRQFWGEALLLSAVAFVLGLMLTEMFLPVFNQLAQKELALRYLSSGWAVLAIVSLLPIIGLLAGSYPAAFLSRFQPAIVLKGALKVGQKNLLTRILVVFQFGLAIFLIVCAIIMTRQQRFIASRDLGFNPDHVLAIKSFAAASEDGEKRILRLRESLAGNPLVLGVTGTNASFNQGWDLNRFEHEGVQRSAFVYRVDPDYFDVLGIELKAGRNFSADLVSDRESAVIVNETLVEEFGWQEPILGRRFSGWNEEDSPGGPVVIGVVKDFHFLSLHKEIRPAMFVVDPEWGINHLLVRIGSQNVPATMQLLGEKWRDVAPNTPFEYSFVNDDLQGQYEAEARWQKIITYSTSFTIILACLGLFGLITLAAGSRTKEIGIRKVLGASISGIVALLSKELSQLVLLANLIAWPFAYFAMNKWLQDFAYRVDVGWWMFVLAGGLALVIAVLTVSTQAVKAALANPVESLRYE